MHYLRLFSFVALALSSYAQTDAPSSSVVTPSLTSGLSTPPIASDTIAGPPTDASSIALSTVLPSQSPAGPPTSNAQTFNPFPAPTQQSIPGLFVQTDPLDPPSVSSGPQVIPNFNDAWGAAIARARVLISGLSLEEKVNITTGVGWMNGRCVGNIPSIRDAFPGLCLEDSPLGVRLADFSTVFPTGINTAATFNRALIRKRGLAMGREFRGKGVHIALGPMMNMGRIAQGGRNWEGFGGDPFLAGEAAYETILGMQGGGVQACAKHYVNNEQEIKRMTSSSNVDDRTQHEVYAHPFLRSVMAGVTSVMCSYNQVNGTYACDNDKILNEILKEEYGFQGYVMTDWFAQHTTLSANRGLDMAMPGDMFETGQPFFGPNLVEAVRNGSVPEGRVDDMATRIIAGWYLLHQNEPSFPNVNFNAFDPIDPSTNDNVDVQEDHHKIVRDIGAASTVLLKNINKALPLKKPRRIAIIGSDAGPALGGPNQFADRGGSSGILACGWGSGSVNFTYLISPLEAIQARAREDRTTVNWHLDDYDTDTAGNIAIQADVALVFINSDSGEQYITVDGNEGDRNNLTAWNNGDNLVQAVAAQNEHTIVVVHSVGPLIVEPWIENPNITAVVWAGLSGTETGNALVDVLYGDVNPSGRLPYTIAKDASDYSAQLALGGEGILQINYTEGLLIDYRHFDANNIDPRFEFGFGLSYTSFNYSALRVREIENGFASRELRKAWKGSEPSPRGQGSSQALWLHEPAYEVNFRVANAGSVPGTEIPQLYINHPPSSGEPPSILKGFTNVFLQPGQTKDVKLTLSRYDLSIWDVFTQSWKRPAGTINLAVGASSRDKRLQGRIPE